MPKEVNKFILEGEEIEFTDSKARQDINTLDDKIDDEVGRLETEINGKATIDDSDITTNKTWSSSQIFAEDNATREITATLNLTNRAEANYNVGDLIVYNSKLYKVIASINQGAALTPGTNIQLSKVSTELKGLENTCGNLQAQINNKATIDDSDITTSKTWSSSKILAEDNSIRENIATFNLTNRAEQNYDVGDLIEWNYKLCKVIAPISQGDLLEVGVNLNRTTVSNELYQSSGSEIDDLVISTQKTWSSNKINSLKDDVVYRQNTLIADKTYNRGEFFEYNNELYKIGYNGVTMGETMAENVNIIKVSNLAFELYNQLQWFHISEDDTVTNSTPLSSYEDGITFTHITNTTDFPYNYGSLVTIKINNFRGFQIRLTDASPAQNKIMFRNPVDSTSWNDWYEIGGNKIQ